MSQRQIVKLFKLTVVGVAPVVAVQLADKRVGIFQRDLADIGLADMADDSPAFNRVLANKLCDLRGTAGGRVAKLANALAMSRGTGLTNRLKQSGKLPLLCPYLPRTDRFTRLCAD